MSDPITWEDWHIPFSRDQITLREAKESLSALGARQDEIPLMIQLVENPRYDIPGFDFFHGAVGRSVRPPVRRAQVSRHASPVRQDERHFDRSAWPAMDGVSGWRVNRGFEREGSSCMRKAAYAKSGKGKPIKEKPSPALILQ